MTEPLDNPATPDVDLDAINEDGSPAGDGSLDDIPAPDKGDVEDDNGTEDDDIAPGDDQPGEDPPTDEPTEG